MKNKRIPELLCPAGDLTRLKTAVDFGADAVYLAGEEFGMRASAAFRPEELADGIAYAHAHGVRVHVACNTIPHDAEMKRLPEFLTRVSALGADAVIASDLGVMRLVRRFAPDCELHVSVQAGTVNAETARAFYELGAKRVVLARELSLAEIAALRADTPPELELEAFVHGAMCVSFSARCLLSDYMAGRDANRGECAQPCRWRYSLVEETRPGQYFDVTEDEKGTYLYNANDLRMAEYLDRLRDAGIDSVKIEGRAKSEYYVAVTANAYRGALDSLAAAPGNWKLPDWVLSELDKISHRPYSTGFYFGRPSREQNYGSSAYIRDYAVAGIVTGYENGRITASLRNKFFRGQTLDCLEAGSVPFEIPVKELYDGDGLPIEAASQAMMDFSVPFARPVRPGSMLRMKTAG